MSDFVKNSRTAASLLLALLLVPTFLTSCLRETTPVSETAGVGRETDPPSVSSDSETSESSSESASDTVSSSDGTGSDSGYVKPPLDSETESAEETDSSGDTVPFDTTPDTSTPPSAEIPTASPGVLWEIKDGKYVYNIPARDDSGLATLDEMYSTGTQNFEDQPDDWFPGKVTRDLQTGEVTYVWDRYKSTLDVLKKYGGIYRGDETRKVCYFTFDCGYEYGPTSKILDTLKEKNVPAIFFLTGQYMKEEDELIARMINEGHLIGNHTVNHVNLTAVSVEKYMEEMDGLEKMYKDKFPGAPAMVYMRPPKGTINEWALKLADKMGYRTVMWSFAYGDYDVNNQPTHEAALNKMKTSLHNGCVFLFHTESETNAAVLGEFIDWIRAEGYEILPICDIK